MQLQAVLKQYQLLIRKAVGRFTLYALLDLASFTRTKMPEGDIVQQVCVA
jgi:hypothetical protein